MLPDGSALPPHLPPATLRLLITLGVTPLSSLTVAGIVFACVFGGSVVAMIVKRFLPDHHLNADSRDVVKLGMGLIATLSALVLGLLIATAKGTYDAQSGLVNEISASYLMLDRVLARYGPETKEARDLLKKQCRRHLGAAFGPRIAPSLCRILPPAARPRHQGKHSTTSWGSLSRKRTHSGNCGLVRLES